jgi:hypothetical protein
LVLTMRRVRTHLGRNDMVCPLAFKLIVAKDDNDEREEGDELGLHMFYSNEVLDLSSSFKPLQTTFCVTHRSRDLGSLDLRVTCNPSFLGNQPQLIAIVRQRSLAHFVKCHHNPIRLDAVDLVKEQLEITFKYLIFTVLIQYIFTIPKGKHLIHRDDVERVGLESLEKCRKDPDKVFWSDEKGFVVHAFYSNNLSSLSSGSISLAWLYCVTQCSRDLGLLN